MTGGSQLQAVLVAACMFLVAACDKTAASKKAEEKIVLKTDIEGLGRLITYPYPPLSAKWATETYPQGGDWALNALLAFKEADAQDLLKGADRLENCHAKLPRGLLTSWFPASVQLEAKSALEGEGDLVAVDAICIRPTPFTKDEKSPAIHGEALVFPRHGLVFLGLYTM